MAVEIRINSSESNKDNGFHTLMTSGLSIVCLEDEKYVVPEEALELLNKRSVSFIVIDNAGKEKVNAAEDKD